MMNTFWSLLFSLAAALTLALSPPAASAEDISALNLQLTQRYLIPRYQALMERAADADEALVQLCEQRDEVRLAVARQQYHEIADAWAAVEHISLGPVTKNFRAERFNHWPGRRHAVDKALTKALAKNQPSLLPPQQFAKASVALQGLAALERLLFTGPETLTQIRAPDAGNRRCALLKAIGTNLRAISAALAQEWQHPTLITALSDDHGHPQYFSSAQSAGQTLLTDFLKIPHKVAYLNLGRVLGVNAALARPKLAEQWRSGRAARSIVVSLESALALYTSGYSERVAAFNRSDDERLRQLFDTALVAARQLPPDFADDVNSAPQRPRFEQALAAVTELRNRLREDVPKGIGLHVGFTSFDGD